VPRAYLIANPTNATVKLTTTPNRELGPRQCAELLESAAEAGGLVAWLTAGCTVSAVGEPPTNVLSNALAGMDLLRVCSAQAMAVGPLP
jgi:hypothetical protein